MATPRFCSACGEKTVKPPGRILPARTYCFNCKPKFNRARFLLLSAFGFCVLGGFLLGYAVTPTKMHYFIGTPAEIDSVHTFTPQDKSPAPDMNATESASPDSPFMTPLKAKRAPRTEPPGIPCGAPTKSGKPCRRKVRGGGFCYQHKNKG